MYQVLFNDNFSGAATPWKVTSGTGVISMTTTAAEFSTAGSAMKLTTSTVASEATEVHRFHGGLPDLPIAAFGGRFASMDENISNFAFYLGWRDGVNWYRSKLLHSNVSNIWQYDAGGSGSANLTTVLTRDTGEISTRAMWHSFLLVADFEAMIHIATSMDEKNFPEVTGKALRQGADPASPFFYDFAIETTNLGGTPSAGVLIFDSLYGVLMDRAVSTGAKGYRDIVYKAINP